MFLLTIAAVIVASQAATPDPNPIGTLIASVAERQAKCRNFTLDGLIALLTQDTFIPTPKDMIEVKERFDKAVNACLGFAEDDSFTYTTTIYPFMLWPEMLLKGLLGGIKLDSTDDLMPTVRRKRGAPYNYSYVDYREKNWVSPVKNQGSCGSCYAFAGTSLMESQYLKNSLGSQNFSEQQIVDCTNKKYGSFNSGCNGGNTIYVLQYFNESVVTQSPKYPYVGKDTQKCQAPSGSPKKVDRAYVTLQSEDHLAYLMNQNGPVIVMINAGSAFQSYASGVYNNAAGCNGTVNHFLNVVGLVKKDNIEQWIMKNSWGPQWGESGFVRFPKGKNMCNMISTGAIVANLNKAITTN